LLVSALYSGFALARISAVVTHPYQLLATGILKARRVAMLVQPFAGLFYEFFEMDLGIRWFYGLPPKENKGRYSPLHIIKIVGICGQYSSANVLDDSMHINEQIWKSTI
jgi:hypothetical protein